MGRIDDSLLAIESIGDTTERAFQLAGLISTLFKLKGVLLVVTGQLAFDGYTNSASDNPTLDLATLTGKLTPRMVLEIMPTQLRAKGMLAHWTLADIPIRFLGDAAIINRDLCRDFTTDYGVVKFLPAEEITAERILASVYPEPDTEAENQAQLLLVHGVTNTIHMDWAALHKICHLPDYRVGEELARMRLAAKKEADAQGASPDHVGQVTVPEESPAPEVAAETVAAPEVDVPSFEPKPARTLSASERAMNAIIDGQ